jgi:hypothetical protein
MKLGLVKTDVKKCWCFLCKWEYAGDDAVDVLIKHLDICHHRIILSRREAKGKVWLEGMRGTWADELPPFVYGEET